MDFGGLITNLPRPFARRREIVSDVAPCVGAVILAGGLSSRMAPASKLLMSLGDRPCRAQRKPRGRTCSRRNLQSSTVIITLIGDVATAYFDLPSLDQQLDITRRTVKTREASLELIRRRHRRGAVSGLDVSRAESELAAARATLPELDRQSLATENRLRILLAENPGPVRRAGRPLTEQFPPQVPAGLPSSLLERRPDLRAAEYNLASANALIGATKAALFPKISLTGLLGGESRGLSDLFIGPARFWSLGLSLLQPILNANASRYQVEAARARTEQALLQYQQTVQQAFREVSDALNDTAQFNAVHAAQQKQVEALSRSSRLAQLRYVSGYSSYLEVLDANRELFSAERDLAARALAHPKLAFFRWFADHPALYRIDRGNPSTCVWFEDLRFATPGRDSNSFRYGLCREHDDWRVFRLLDDGTREAVD